MSKTINSNILNIERKFSVSRETLYQAWTKPEYLQKWHAPGDLTVKEASADVRVDGEYKIVMQSDKGTHIVIGSYKEVIPNEKLVYTWQWQDNECSGKEPNETLVTLNFKSVDEKNSTLLLTHERFTSEEAKIDHAKGWEGCLANLELKHLN
ncbi:MAG: ATPase [Planctomycetota bacterium]|nr:MAG: ATPase [Planctomycetota bacterium]